MVSMSESRVIAAAIGQERRGQVGEQAVLYRPNVLAQGRNRCSRPRMFSGQRYPEKRVGVVFAFGRCGRQ